MLRVAARRSATAPRLSLLGVRHRSTEGPVEAKITSQHPTHKDKDEKVLAKAREIARDVASGKQSPNREVVWSNSQQPRQMGMRGPRFEQTEIDKQAAIELIAQVPIRMETRRIVSCDGGGGALGHPKVYINLDKAGEPNVCPYCGIRFQMAEHRAHELSATGGN